MTKKEYWYWLCGIEGIGARKINYLLEKYKTPEHIFSAPLDEIKQIKNFRETDAKKWIEAKEKKEHILEQYHKLSEQGIRFVTMEEEEYPKKLKEIYDCPAGLYVKGKLPAQNKPAVSIVGARACSSYGREMAEYFGKTLAGAGVQIISGMAAGIDCSGQWGALKGGGETFAVLGTGIDICYPKENIELYIEAQKHGGVISEFPLGMKGLPYLFPMRNRVISGLSDCVIVIEARERSGSLITADQALEQGREVFALPGKITDRMSKGCNQLIRQGASILTKPEDILEFLHIILEEGKTEKPEFKNRNSLSREEQFLLQLMGEEEIHLEILLEKTNMPIGLLNMSLLQLEMKEYIEQPVKNYYIKKKN